MMKDVKAAPKEFREIDSGAQTQITALATDNFVTGDYVTIREFDPRLGSGKFTGAVAVRRVTSVQTGAQLHGGAVLSPRYVILSLAVQPEAVTSATGNFPPKDAPANAIDGAAVTA